MGADPELRYTPNDGTAVATLRVATNETWKERVSGERKQRTEWHRVACFGRLAEIVCQYLTKGSYVYFEGRIQTRQYTLNLTSLLIVSGIIGMSGSLISLMMSKTSAKRMMGVQVIENPSYPHRSPTGTTRSAASPR